MKKEATDQKKITLLAKEYVSEYRKKNSINQKGCGEGKKREVET